MNKQDLIKAYKGKNVYITGITGFKGAWMANMLHHLGANVYGIGLEPETEDSIFTTSRVAEFAKVTIGDITEPAHQPSLFREYTGDKYSSFITSFIEAEPDYVFHMAAQPIVSIGYKDPYNTFHVNIMGTVILHEILRGAQIPADKNDPSKGYKKISVINVTTDKAYKEAPRALVEGDELFGFDPYSLSKSCSDMISTSYRDAMGSNHYISTVRAGNVIGGGDMAPNRIIPDIVRAVTSKEDVELRNPNSVRPYQHVFDAINAYLQIAVLQQNNPELQGEWNVGPDANLTMTTGELADNMKKHMEFDWVTTNKSIGKENDYLVLANDKIKSHGWVPAYKTNESVVESVSNWYNSYINGKDMQKVTLEQIEEAYKYD